MPPLSIVFNNYAQLVNMPINNPESSSDIVHFYSDGGDGTGMMEGSSASAEAGIGVLEGMA
jgi:hypothetical protein